MGYVQKRLRTYVEKLVVVALLYSQSLVMSSETSWHVECSGVSLQVVKSSLRGVVMTTFVMLDKSLTIQMTFLYCW
jgi:hypothetical protein